MVKTSRVEPNFRAKTPTLVVFTFLDFRHSQCSAKSMSAVLLFFGGLSGLATLFITSAVIATRRPIPQSDDSPGEYGTARTNKSELQELATAASN
jgi:hypothetical protein